MKKHIPTIIIFTIIIGVIALGIWYSDKNSPIKELAKLDVYSEEELRFLEEQGFLNNIDSENLPSNKEQIISLLKSVNLIEQNLDSPDESFEVLATKLDDNTYQLAFKLENKSNQSKVFYLIPVSESSQTEFKEIKGIVKSGKISLASQGDWGYDIEKHKQELRPELAQAYDDIDNNGYTGKPIRLVLEANSTLLAQSKWEIIRGPTSDKLEPVYLLVYGSSGGMRDDLDKDISFEQLDKVEKEMGIYRITYDKYSDVEIKDQDTPEVKLRKWGDETYIKVSYPDFTPVSPKQDKGKMKWINGNKEVHLYPLEPIEFEENGRTVKQLENGGFEFEIILKEKPASNKMVLDIETQGLRFSYQPDMRDKKGVFQPENVVGSYAVYHETQAKFLKTKEEGDKYKAGIAFHIYRPKIIDSNGWEVWGELKYDKEAGTLTVEMPQDFVDNAVYPIRHAAGLTIGYTTKGGSEYGTQYAFATHTGVSPDNSAGTVTELKIAATSEDFPIKVGVYTESGSDTPNSLIDNSSSTFTPSSPDGDGYYDAGISGFEITANTRYWLANIVPLGTNQKVYYNNDVVSPKWTYWVSATYDDWMLNTFPAGSALDWRFSIYVTYTPAEEEELIDDLVSYYKLDDTNDTDAVDAHGDNDGTQEGTTDGVAGKINTAFDFDGSDDYVDLNDPANIRSITSNLTVSLWFKPSETIDSGISGDIGLLDYGLDGSDGNWLIFWEADDNGKLRLPGTYGGNVQTNRSTWTAGEWYHVVFTTTDPTSDIKAYVNGSLDNTGSGDSIEGASYTFTLGARRQGGTPGEYFNGIIDEVTIWNRALTQDEITALYNGGDGLAYPFTARPSMRIRGSTIRIRGAKVKIK